MKTLLTTLEPLTAFATPLQGDTLFGQLCWAFLRRYGEAWLTDRLEGYTDNKPFLVVSDGLPADYFPRPHLPPGILPVDKTVDRKTDKRKLWLHQDGLKKTVADWVRGALSEEEIWQEHRKERPQPHNSISRLTGTTGEDGFAPYVVNQTWFPPGAHLDLWLIHDENRVTVSQLETAVIDVGQTGFGRDASAGLGKWRLKGMQEVAQPRQQGANTWLTLGFCAPQGGGFDPDRSFYRVFTRFGRHGDVAALSGKVFKSPVLMAHAGAVLTPQDGLKERYFVGRGLGGRGTLSDVIPGTVHQGYCPVVGMRLPEKGRHHG